MGDPSQPHSPTRRYCPDVHDGTNYCCGADSTGWLVCVVDGQRWPCETKRAHMAARGGRHHRRGMGQPESQPP